MLKKEGSGWRLAWDPERENYCVFIGGKDWAIELTYQEWESLFCILKDLVKEYEKVKKQLMDDESIQLDIERNVWWIRLDGDRYSWSLKFILQGNLSRGVEFYLPRDSAIKMFFSMRSMWESFH